MDKFTVDKQKMQDLHDNAATHYQKAAEQHSKAATHHKAGEDEKGHVAAHKAQGYAAQAVDHATNASKHSVGIPTTKE